MTYGSVLFAIDAPTLVVVKNFEGVPAYFHEVKEGETSYGLCRTMNTDMLLMAQMNPDLQLNILSVGKKLLMPLLPETVVHAHTEASSVIRVYYQVGKGETLYSISKHVFELSVKEIIGLNQKEDENISIDELLYIGYIETSGGVRGQREEIVALDESSSGAIVELENSIETSPAGEGQSILPDIDEDVEEDRLHMTRGKATWRNYEYQASEFLALHRTARPNTSIEIYNPMLNRSISATVVGQIPENTYPADISVVISPNAATALGALDRQFLVEMTYIE